MARPCESLQQQPATAFFRELADLGYSAVSWWHNSRAVNFCLLRMLSLPAENTKDVSHPNLQSHEA